MVSLGLGSFENRPVKGLVVRREWSGGPCPARPAEDRMSLVILSRGRDAFAAALTMTSTECRQFCLVKFLGVDLV